MTVREYPIYTQIRWFNNGVINDETELNQVVADDRLNPLDYIAFINHAPYVYTADVTVALKRYNMLKSYGIPSYSNDFDGLPATSVDTLSLIDTELESAKEAFQKVKQNNG